MECTQSKAHGTNVEIGVAFEHLNGLSLFGIKHIPVIDSGIGHKANGALANPLPKYHVFSHLGALKFLFLLQVENLNCSLLRSQSNYLTIPVHNGTVSLNRSPNHIVIVFKVNNDNLRLRGLGLFLSNAYEGI